MYLASEVQKRSNAPVQGQKLATKVSKSRAISPYVPGVNPPGWPLISALVYNDETSSVTSKELADKLPMVRSLLTYLSLVLVSLWLTKVVYLQTSIQNLRTNSNIYSIHLTIPYILKEPFLSV